MKPTFQSYECVDKLQGEYHKNAACEQDCKSADRHAKHSDDVSSQFFMRLLPSYARASRRAKFSQFFYRMLHTETGCGNGNRLRMSKHRAFK